jgi:hypothetical protein
MYSGSDVSDRYIDREKEKRWVVGVDVHIPLDRPGPYLVSWLAEMASGLGSIMGRYAQ